MRCRHRLRTVHLQAVSAEKVPSIYLLLMVKRRVTFLAKAEYFTTKGLKGRASRLFFAGIGQLPVDRDDKDAARGALTAGVRILDAGELLGIYPEGTRSPDGRLY